MARKNKLSVKPYLNTSLKGIEVKGEKHILYPLYIRVTCDRQQAQFKSNFHGFIPINSQGRKNEKYYIPFHEANRLNEHRSFLSPEEWTKPNDYQHKAFKLEIDTIEKVADFHLKRGKNIIGPGFSGIVSWSCWSIIEVVLYTFIKTVRREMFSRGNYLAIEVILSHEVPDESMFSGLQEIFSDRDDDLAKFFNERSDDIMTLSDFIYKRLKIKLGRSFKPDHEELFLTPRVFDWAIDESVNADLLDYLITKKNYEKRRAESFITSIQESIRSHYSTHFKAEMDSGNLILPF